MRRRFGFGFGSERERQEAELFYADLMGRPRVVPAREDAAPAVEDTELVTEDAADDRTRSDVRDDVTGRARAPRSSFLSQADLARAIGPAATPEVSQLIDAAVAAAAPERRLADAGGAQATAHLINYWALVQAGGQRVVDAIERDRFRCTTAGNALVVDGAVVDGMRSTWTRTGETLTLGALCRGAPAGCPAPHAPLHSPTGGTGSLAAHFTGLSQDLVRTTELSGLFGVDLRPVAGAQRPSTAVKDLPAAAPLQALSFAAIRRGEQREIHVAREAPRRVESWVDGQQWLSLPSSPGMAPGTGYRLFKRRFWEASLHRQWGTQSTIAWILGLASFVRDRTGQMLGVGDISHVVGEVITDHGSHRVGKDLDCYVLDAPPAGSTFPVAYWCSGTAPAPELRELVAPSATDAHPLYGEPGAAVAAIADPRRTALFDRYATILAYCVATQASVTAAVWHGAPSMSARALALAQQAWDDTAAANAGTTASPGWRATWGAGPTQRAAIVAPRAGLFVGDGSGNYGPGRGWPPHHDHIHVRLS